MPTTDSKLGAFLMHLAEDPAIMSEFQKDPKGTMKSFRLSDAQQQVVLQKNSAQMSAALATLLKGGRFGGKGGISTSAADNNNTTVVVVVVVVAMTGDEFTINR